jgi:hypothetical protein
MTTIEPAEEEEGDLREWLRAMLAGAGRAGLPVDQIVSAAGKRFSRGVEFRLANLLTKMREAKEIEKLDGDKYRIMLPSIA